MMENCNNGKPGRGSFASFMPDSLAFCIPNIPIFHHSNIPDLSPPSKPRIKGISQAFTNEVEREDRDENGQPRENSQPPGIEDISSPLGENISPARRRRLNSKAKETQTGFHKNR
jgi:hypothetical protein